MFAGCDVSVWLSPLHLLLAVVDDAVMERGEVVGAKRTQRVHRSMVEKRRIVESVLQPLIKETEEMPSSSAYRSRFDKLVRAYTLVGFTRDRDCAFIELNRSLRRFRAKHCKLREAKASVRQDPITELFIVNEEFSMSLIMARCQATGSGSRRWNLRFDASLRPDVTVTVRLEPDNQAVQDYYL